MKKSGLDVLAGFGKAMNSGVEIELKNPDSKEGLGVFVTVTGRHSERYKKAQREQVARMQKAAREAAQDGQKYASDDNDQKNEAVKLLSACIVAWRTGEDKTVIFQGKEHEFTPANAEKLLGDSDLVLMYNQVDEAVHKDSNFMKA